VKVYWTETAIGDLIAIREYIAKDSPQSADSVIDNLIARSEQISTFPLSGRVVPEFRDEKLREVIEGSYRIIYYLESIQVNIIAVRHGSKPIALPEF
jgi:toxin ParE1/3/4